VKQKPVLEEARLYNEALRDVVSRPYTIKV
jgi:hypothetical protein